MYAIIVLGGGPEPLEVHQNSEDDLANVPSLF